jgi:hypothetical protein
MKPLNECRYSACISYASADDQATDGWIGSFSELFGKQLRNRLGRLGVRQPQDIFVSGQTGPVFGSLPNSALRAIEDSYAMVIVVFNAYVRSDWSLKEVDHFRNAFGADGMRDRLHVVALSKSAMEEMAARPEWTRLMPPDQQWIPFYREDNVDVPVQQSTWLGHRHTSSLRFDRQLTTLLDAFESSIRQDLRQPRPPPTWPAAGAPIAEHVAAEVVPPQSPRGAPVAITSDPSDPVSALPAESSGVRGDAAVFCPAIVGRASVFLVQALLYTPDRAAEAHKQALEADATAQRRGVLALSPELPLGTRLDLRLEVPALRVDEPDAAVVWTGNTTAAQFEVAVPADAEVGNTIGRLRLSVAGVPIGTLRFQFSVTAGAAAAAPGFAQTEAKRYRHAFVSYSSSDRAEVLRRVQAFRIAGVSVFQDVLDLEPGQLWERELYREIDRSDVVLLFWSTAAAASPWVAKEIDYALALKQGRDDQPPDIAPVPIEGPPIPPPPESLRHLHFNDALLAHILAAQVPPN